MGARLVELEGGERVARHPIRKRGLLIGRDPEVDVYLEHPRISRQHALVEPTEDGFLLSDLGSSNGTKRNGQPVHEPVELDPGDRIELGDDVVLVFETGLDPRTVVQTLVALGLGVVLLSGAYLGRDALQGLGGADDPLMSEAVALAEQGARRFGEGDVRGAKQKVNAAVGLLLTSHHLDGFETDEVQHAGLALLRQRMEGDFDLEAIYADAGEHGGAGGDRGEDGGGVRVAEPVAARETEGRPLLGTKRGPCRLDRIEAADVDLCVRERAERILMELWQDPREIPESFYGAVNEQFRLLLANRREWVEGSLERGEPLRGMMDEELTEAKVPTMLRYLSMIESGYHKEIVSKAGARGLWQFMPQTARHYGLAVSDRKDERTDPRKSTRAAARYLRDLAFEFGGDSLLLAIASYNKGENGIRSALKRLDDPRTDRSYWSLVERELLPSETRDYVPRLVAVAVMGEAGIPPNDVLAPMALDRARQ